MEKKESYGLFTTIAMIVGIVIGSGIYFRADDIFMYTNGNLALGLFVLALGASCIVFGSLTISELSKRHLSSGGLVAYFEHFISEKMASGFGWFQLFVYLPAIAIVVGWAAAIYTFMLFDIEATLFMQVSLGLAYNLFFVLINTLSRSFGGLVQRFTTVIKLAPLVIIAVYGIFFAKPIDASVLSNSSFLTEFSNYHWITALVPLAFSYDGWVVALSIAPEVINQKKNMSRALILSPLIILAVYLAYIYGIANILGTQQILSIGDGAVFEAGKMVLGDRNGNILLAVVVVSMLGVLNGVNLGTIRMPQALAEKKIIPDYGLSEIDPKKQLSIKSAIMVAVLEIIWASIHFMVMKLNLFNGRDVSEISIVFSYVSYIILYVLVFNILRKEGKKLKLIIPILATLGSLTILMGSLITSPFYISIFILICSSVMGAGYIYKSSVIAKHNV